MPLKKIIKKVLCLFLAAAALCGTLPLEANASESEDDIIRQALYRIPDDFNEIEFFGNYTVPETVTVDEAKARLEELVQKFEGKFFTVSGSYCTSSGVHATSCNNCLMSNVIATDWVRELVGMGHLDPSLCPTQFNYNGSQWSSDGWQCFGFANFAHWFVFAKRNTDKISSTLEFTGPMTYETIRKAFPGDVIRTNYYGGHSMVFISCDESGFTVIDSNFSTTYSCQVKVHKVKYNSKYTVAVTGVKNYKREDKKGDINLDGIVDITDVFYARLAAAKLVSLDEKQITVGDVDFDGKVTAIDANIIRKYAAKLIEKFPEQ